eukprot:2658318-Rhodomonas_salina.1
MHAKDHWQSPRLSFKLARAVRLRVSLRLLVTVASSHGCCQPECPVLRLPLSDSDSVTGSPLARRANALTVTVTRTRDRHAGGRRRLRVARNQVELEIPSR